MSWFGVLKMPNPYGGRWADLTSSEYYTMDDNNKRDYHKSMQSFYQRQVNQAVTPRKAGQAPPATDDQIRGLRELLRFHDRQGRRLRFDSPKDTYYSLDEETNRTMYKPTYDAVERIPHTTKEMYDNYTRKDKMRYWGRLAEQLKSEYGQTDTVAFAKKMYRRMATNPNYTPPFEGDKSTREEYGDKHNFRDISEYDNFTDEEKGKYHLRMRDRAKRDNKNDEMKFHNRMHKRIANNSPLPIYPTLEAQKEAKE